MWCDTQSVWRHGNPYTFSELFRLMEAPEYDLIRKLREGQHLVLTGGSPLKQQHRLVPFFEAFKTRYGFIPFLEIENECTLVFTEKYLRERGYCCGNGCRHCPYSPRHRKGNRRLG